MVETSTLINRTNIKYIWQRLFHEVKRGRRGRDRMIVGFTTTYVISVYHHWCCEFDSRSGRGVVTLCDTVCQLLAAGRWFSPGPPVSSTNKTDSHDIAEILLKVALNTIKQQQTKSRLKHYIATLFTALYVRFGILLACGKHLHERTISLRGEVWVHKLA